jgi:hypothetical protein
MGLMFADGLRKNQRGSAIFQRHQRSGLSSYKNFTKKTGPVL